MADPQVDTASANAAAKGREGQRNPSEGQRPAEQQREATARAGERGERIIEGERRSFVEAQREVTRTAAVGFDAARDIARRSAETTRQLTENSRRTGAEMVEMWRSALDPLLNAQFEANRWFDQFWRQTTGLGALPALMPARPFASSPAPMFGLPPADVRENDQAYELAVELPGLAREEVDLRIMGDALVISGRKLESRESNGATYRMSERCFGRFERSFPIPPDVRRENVEANFRDGLLTVTLPKADEARMPVSHVEVRA
jgi:HSP20 family protein